jgi:hypothetical protein
VESGHIDLEATGLNLSSIAKAHQVPHGGGEVRSDSVILRKMMNFVFRFAAFVLVTAAPATLFLGAILGVQSSGLALGLLFALLVVLPSVLAGFVLAAPFVLALWMLNRWAVPYFLAVGAIVGAFVGGFSAYALQDAPVEPLGPQAVWYLGAIGAGYGLWGAIAWFVAFDSLSTKKQVAQPAS